jgi:hypothetical protein
MRWESASSKKLCSSVMEPCRGRLCKGLRLKSVSVTHGRQEFCRKIQNVKCRKTTTAGTQVLDRWWQDLNRYVPASSTATWYKVATQFHASVATYTYSYMWRCHLRIHANWLAEVVSVAWDRIWWGEAMIILHQGSPRLNNSAWPYFRFVKYYHLPRSVGMIGHSSFNPCEVFLPMLCPCIFTMACA